MAVNKIAISLEGDLVQALDDLVAAGVYKSRSAAIADAVREKVKGWQQNRLERECAKLDATFEQAMAEEGLSGDATVLDEF